MDNPKVNISKKLGRNRREKASGEIFSLFQLNSWLKGNRKAGIRHFFSWCLQYRNLMQGISYTVSFQKEKFGLNQI